jgi:hypothetical protein
MKYGRKQGAAWTHWRPTDEGEKKKSSEMEETRFEKRKVIKTTLYRIEGTTEVRDLSQP